MRVHVSPRWWSPRHLISISRTLAPLLVLACGQAPVTAPDAADLEVAKQAAVTELVINGGFGSSTAPWWNGSNTQSRVENGQWRVDVTGGTTNPWDAIVGQDGIPLVNGQAYTLSFTASATASVSVRATVQLGTSPYTATLDQQISLTTTPRRFSFPFTSSLTTNVGQVTFQLGGRGALTVRLDDISLTTGSNSGGSGPLGMTSGFYVDPNSNSASWVSQNSGDSRASRIQSAIASKPGARWYGNWNENISEDVSNFVGAADAADKLPLLVAYNIPARDCGSHSAGGADKAEIYRAWITAFANAIGNRPAIVVLEPDAVAQLDCLPNDSERQIRLDLLRYATEQLRVLAPNTWTYLDGGNAKWIAADTMAQRLEAAGVRNVRGFAVNVSNFYTTDESVRYAEAVNISLSNRYGYTRPFVVDTSRNGKGHTGIPGDFCNPPGRKLGTLSQVGGGAEMLLWVKVPGDSDGQCGIAPGVRAGQFSPDLATRLIDGT